MKRARELFFAVGCLVVVLAGCGDTGGTADTTTSTSGDATGLPNPAAVFCEAQGGFTFGPEPMCELPDGTVVDAWDFFRSQTGIDDLVAVSVDNATGAADGLIAVRGMLIGDSGMVRLCSALAESFPPQCGGAFVVVTGLTAADMPDLPGAGDLGLQTEQDVTWSDAVVTMTASMEAGALTAVTSVIRG